jgi:Xaa-Pro aminopeptidase
MSALLLYGDTERSPALRHELPLAIIDPLLFVERDGHRVVLTSYLERARIAGVAPDAEILDYLDFGLRELRANGLTIPEAEREVVVRVMQHLGIDQATVPSEFPVGLADRLRAEGVQVSVDDVHVQSRRRAKQGRELDGVRAAQRAAEAGMTAAAALLSQAEPGPEGRLQLEGQELLAEQVRAALRSACAQAGASCPPDVMVSTVWNGGGHDPGSGPLPSGLPIQVDLWPRDEVSGCWADMTRTFVVGSPSPEHSALIAQQEELVTAALNDSFALVRPGVRGRDLFDAVCDRFEASGFRTQRTGPGEDEAEGFQFSLGHGVGLEIHEEPTLGIGHHDELVAGDVLAIEPGLWDRRIGGVRFEDLVLVTDDGYELLTQYPYSLDPAG